MKIAILGFGTVGSGVYEIIKNDIKNKLKLKVEAIFVRPEKSNVHKKMTADYDEILNNREISLVVETLGGIHPAKEMIMQALNANKHVVTANKAVVARYLDEFKAAAIKHHVHIFFESCVGGGIPWITNLQRVLRIDNVKSISGIFNGTSNFILDKMTSDGMSFEDALSDAKKLGYAESDPTADIDGYDIENKLCISSDLAFSIFIKPGTKIIKYGIRNINDEDIKYFNKHNWNIKLMGTASFVNKQLSISVLPTLISKDQQAATVRGNLNYISLSGDNIGELDFIGQGAGKMPTAHALIQDIQDVQLSSCNEFALGVRQYDLDGDNILSDYIVRSKFDLSELNLQSSDNRYYWEIKNASMNKINSIMQRVLKLDENAFLAKIS